MATPPNEEDRVDVPRLLSELGARDIVNLMVEGGGGVLGSLFDAGLVDKLYAFVAPVVIGGAGAASPVAGQGASRMAETWQLTETALRQIGPDWLITGYPVRRS